MFTPDQYELLDFGGGRKLERIAGMVLDRPSPAAEGAQKTDPAAWKAADFRYDRRSGGGTWKPSDTGPKDWTIRHGECSLRLKLTPFGQAGVFPEQADNWDWVARQVKRARRPIKVLNLFAYTGGSTLAAAAAGAELTHVDAAKNVVAWARENAALSALDDAPIRWITEDAAKFAARELKRDRRYDAVILDPPSYGHGPQGESWKIGEDLPVLLETCRQLLADHPAFFLLTCHSPGFGPAELEAILSDTLFGRCGQGVAAGEMDLMAADGRRLNAGVAARWPG